MTERELAEVMALLGRVSPHSWEPHPSMDYSIWLGGNEYLDFSIINDLAASDSEVQAAICAAVNWLRANGPALLSRADGGDDSARLDWLQAVFEGRSPVSFGHYARGCMGCEIFTVPTQHVKGYGIRGAIDAAMAKERGDG